jgi:hypothetical protein
MHEYPEGSGWWGVVVDLLPGVHQYKFCVRTLYPGDDVETRWVHDTEKRRVADGFGGWNNEVEVTRTLVEASRYINLDAMMPKGTREKAAADGKGKGFDIGADGVRKSFEIGRDGKLNAESEDDPENSAPENTPNLEKQSTSNPPNNSDNATAPEKPPYERPILHPHAHDLIMKRQIQANYEQGKLQYCFGVSNDDIAVLVTNNKFNHKYQTVIFYEDSNEKGTSEKKLLESELEFKMRGQSARNEKFQHQQEMMKKK